MLPPGVNWHITSNAISTSYDRFLCFAFFCCTYTAAPSILFYSSSILSLEKDQKIRLARVPFSFFVFLFLPGRLSSSALMSEIRPAHYYPLLVSSKIRRHRLETMFTRRWTERRKEKGAAKWMTSVVIFVCLLHILVYK